MIRNTVLLGTSSVLILLFQNCTGQSMVMMESFDLPADPAFFNYKYNEATPYYHDLKVLRGPAESGVQTFQIAGSISKSDPDDASSISWRIRLVANDGSFTPTISGNNQLHGTLVFVEDIVGSANKVFEKLWVEITYDGIIEVYETNLELEE